MRNLHSRFDWHYIGQIYSGDFAKFCGLLRIYELYLALFFASKFVKYNFRIDMTPIVYIYPAGRKDNGLMFGIIYRIIYVR